MNLVLVFRVFICQFHMNTLTTFSLTQRISTLRIESCHHSNPVATNSAGVCQYDITHTTITRGVLSKTTLCPQFKDNKKIKNNFSASRIQLQQLQKRTMNFKRFMGPINVEQVHL